VEQAEQELTSAATGAAQWVKIQPFVSAVPSGWVLAWRSAVGLGSALQSR
jgi:hypothetical protein